MNIHQFLINRFRPSQLTGEESSKVIHDELMRSGASMIARFGSVEIKGIIFPLMPLLIQHLMRDKVLFTMQNNAGFFPASKAGVERFSDMMIEDMKLLDVLGSWRIEERLLQKFYPRAMKVKLNGLEPYLSSTPWSAALEGVRVLVVHPFNTTIESQYNEKRHLLFLDQRVLPEFKSLQTVKAVQTIAGNKSRFNDWFEALESMKAAIDEKNYDVAILGCGAYGFPLAAHVKRSGKKAIHLGGATQILFGIKGQRWDNHPVISKLYNDSWVRPTMKDIPSGANKVESGCYW